ncbi:MAG TPA: ABC transporter ATP-binding protein [Roseiarcus sp.]|nr:ABC transporter ATP-binding protein [Roseiarcus sp.]
MPPELLRVSGLKSGYGRIPILFGIDFAVGKGEFVGILGHNGMGKTTLLRTLMGHLKTTAGSIWLAGENISDLPPEQRARRGIGYVPQGRQIFPALSVLENLRVAAFRLSKAAAQRKINEVLEELPRLKPILARTGGALSGGEQQILALARCLCASPRLMLLDEPTEGVQPSICDEIQLLLGQLAKRSGLSIVLVEQNLDFISALSNRVLIIRKGLLTDELHAASLHESAVASALVGR